MEELELHAAQGSIAPELESEFPGLRLLWVTLAARLRPSPPPLRRRLAELSSRYRGENVVAMRTLPIPHAYRAFFRQIGLDPDTTRIPAEAAAVRRLMDGGFRSRNVVDDARLIAVIETGVPVWALDADLVAPGGLGIRVTVSGDRLGAWENARHLVPGRLAVADAQNVHALLFEEVAVGHEVSRRTERIALFSLGVEGVPSIHIEEALWIGVEAIRAS